jgi:hypothetical protein
VCGEDTDRIDDIQEEERRREREEGDEGAD